MTWGISGRTFLLIYSLAVLIVLVGNAWLRRRPLGPRLAAKAKVAPLGVDELAYLAAGVDRLGLSALVGLCETGAAFVVASHRVAVDPRRASSTSVTSAQRTLYQAILRRDVLDVRETGAVLAQTPTLRVIRASLKTRGLIPNAQLRARHRAGAVAFAVVLGVGVARVAAGISANHPAPYLILLMIATVFVAVRSLRLRPVTSAGLGVLRQAREEAAELATASRAGQRALAVALFGPDALWYVAPSLAAGLGLPEPVPQDDLDDDLYIDLDADPHADPHAVLDADSVNPVSA